MKLNNYIEILRENRNLSREEFGLSLNVTSVQIGRYENGKNTPSEIVIQLLEKLYDADGEYIKTEILRMKMAKQAKKMGIGSFSQIIKLAPDPLTASLSVRPAITTNIPPKGIPVLNSGPCSQWRDLTDLDYPAGHADRFELAPTKDINAFYLVASGDSMIGGNIEDGDLLLVEPNKEWRDGDIVFAKTDDGCTIKRIFRHEDRVELRPMNPSHKSLFVSGDESFRVMRVAGNFKKY